MSETRQIVHCCLIRFSKLIQNTRMYTVMIFISIYLYSVIAPVRSFASVIGYPCAPWLYPFLMADSTTLIYVMLGCIVIFSDAPFVDEQQPYVIMRTGKRIWFAGQMYYICFVSFIYFFYILIISILLLIPNLSYSQNWGKIIGTLVRTNAGEQIGVYGMNLIPKILLTYTPLQAVGCCFLLSWFLGMLIGFTLFFCNMLFNKIVGAIVVNACVLLAAFTYDVGGERIFYISPFSWVNLSKIDVTGTSVMPSFVYALTCVMSLCFLFILVCGFIFRKRDVTVIIEEN